MYIISLRASTRQVLAVVSTVKPLNLVRPPLTPSKCGLSGGVSFGHWFEYVGSIRYIALCSKIPPVECLDAESHSYC